MGCLHARPQGHNMPLLIQRYVCPWCKGTGAWSSGEDCMACSGAGTTDDPKPGVDLTVKDYPEEAGHVPADSIPEPLPRPPAVMKAPCVDCAYRPGSPEGLGENSVEQESKRVFYCHHGMKRIDGEAGVGYLSVLEVGGMPIGSMVCASWYARVVENRAVELDPFRDPVGPAFIDCTIGDPEDDTDAKQVIGG